MVDYAFTLNQIQTTATSYSMQISSGLTSCKCIVELW